MGFLLLRPNPFRNGYLTRVRYCLAAATRVGFFGKRGSFTMFRITAESVMQMGCASPKISYNFFA